MAVSAPRVVLIEVTPQRTVDTKALLAAAGCELVATLAMDSQLLKRLPDCRADLVVLSPESPDGQLLRQLAGIQQVASVPLVILSAECDSTIVEHTVEAGASAYVVDGVEPDRLPSIFSAAQARFRQLRSLSEELDKARSQLSQRKLIERAKGIIMAERGTTEEQAYQLMRKTAMDRNKRLVDIAESIVSASELLGGQMVPNPVSVVRMKHN